MRVRRARAAWPALVLAAVAVGLAAQSSGASDSGHGEAWAPAQDSGKVYVVRGRRPAEEVTDPAVLNPHLINFSDSGDYAYVSDVGNGKLNIFEADDRELVASLTFASVGNDTHQAKPSPDTSVLLVARRVPARTLHKVLADEDSESWTVSPQQLSFGPTRAPICTVFRADGERAYVSLAPSGIAVVDVATMTLVTDTSAGSDGIFDTNGAVACGMSEAGDERTVYVSSNGGAGSTSGTLYQLDTISDTLMPVMTVQGTDLHFLDLSRNDRRVYITARGSEALKIVDLRKGTVDDVSLDPTPGPLNDQPDGVNMNGGRAFVALKNSGKLAQVGHGGGSVHYMDLAPPSANALPHVTIRP